jgi:hypothetical protein
LELKPDTPANKLLKKKFFLELYEGCYIELSDDEPEKKPKSKVRKSHKLADILFLILNHIIEER